MSKKSSRSNNSIVYSFTKAKRFIQLKRVQTPEYIDFPSTLNERSCSFGKGKRWTPANQAGKDAPSPGAYELKSAFEKNDKGPTLKKKPKISIRSDAPGPGSYSPFSPLGKHGPKFSFRVRVANKERVFTPPPGTYRPCFAQVEKSSFKNISFGMGNRSEIYGKLDNVPGPGSYNVYSARGDCQTNRSSSRFLSKRENL
jgi:hypothetical protein